MFLQLPLPLPNLRRMHTELLGTTLTVLMFLIASSAAFALNSPLKTLRFFSLTTTPVFQKATILNDCPKIGVHYSQPLYENAAEGGFA